MGGSISGRPLEGQVAIVTGAGSQTAGIGNGRAAAVLLAAAGARVVVVDTVPANLDDTCALIAARGGQSLRVPADVSTMDGCRRVVEETIRTWGRVDILVNNVGIAGPPGSVVDVDIEEFQSCVQVNLISMALMARFAIPHMRSTGGGSIVNMSSAAGLLGGHPYVAYSTTKAAVVGLTRTMAATHGPEGIRVNAIAPGFVHTPMVYGRGLPDEERERRRLGAPLRTEGTGWDVGEAVLFLAGPGSRWITGVVLPVDAGLTATLGHAPDIYRRLAQPGDDGLARSPIAPSGGEAGALGDV